MIYVDKAVIPWRGRVWAHLLGTDLDELHAFAAGLGLRREWFQDKRIPHYDVPTEVRERALRAGAVAISARRLPGDIVMRDPEGGYTKREEILRRRAAARRGA